jgi:hypothetical protein
MKKQLLILLLMGITLTQAHSADPPPVLGICIEAPGSEYLKPFLRFMEEELAPNGINTMVLMVNHNYEYRSYPNLQNEGALSKKEVRKIVRTAREHGIRIIPQINLLGHQSWHTRLKKLLQEYPEFDENPSVKMPEKYEWPNEDGLYCKSYCPLHPEVHEVVFALVDEIMEVFEADAFHAGMDEVFYIGEDECPRCGGKDHSELFAGEVNRVHAHLAEKGRELWIWGDRLIDGKTTGMGLWEASENDTHRAIDMISREVVICDWHYERADPTAAMFALKGFRVITCPWKRVHVTKGQLEMFQLFRENSTRSVKDRYYGVMQTVWSGAADFLDEYYTDDPELQQSGQDGSLREIFRFYSDGQ